MLLFVYGTLRRCCSHPMAKYLAERARWLGAGMVGGKLYDLGRYPGMTPASTAEATVRGDVYEVTDAETLAELDRYENAESPLPAHFERQTTTARLSDGRTVTVEVYWFRGSVREEQRIVSGDYAERLQRGETGDK